MLTPATEVPATPATVISIAAPEPAAKARVKSPASYEAGSMPSGAVLNSPMEL